MASRLPGDEQLPLQIVRMDEDDIDLILKIEERVFSAPWSREAFHMALEQPIIQAWVGRLGDEVAGYVITSLTSSYLLIANLAVDLWARRQGVGRRLMEFVLDYSIEQGARWAYLDVRCSNEGAIRLYRQLGFEVVGKRADYYTDPSEDSLVMMRSLE
jgi:[ribosomal protein S18]-alanine N-acetyltransferase